MRLTPIGDNPTEGGNGYMKGCKFFVGLAITAALFILVAWAQGADKQPIHVIPHDPKYTTFNVDDFNVDVICENHVSPAVELTGRMATVSCDPEKEGMVRRYGPATNKAN